MLNSTYIYYKLQPGSHSNVRQSNSSYAGSNSIICTWTPELLPELDPLEMALFQCYNIWFQLYNIQSHAMPHAYWCSLLPISAQVLVWCHFTNFTVLCWIFGRMAETLYLGQVIIVLNNYIIKFINVGLMVIYNCLSTGWFGWNEWIGPLFRNQSPIYYFGFYGKIGSEFWCFDLQHHFQRPVLSQVQGLTRK